MRPIPLVPLPSPSPCPCPCPCPAQEFERGTLSFTLGAGDVIKGWDRGIVGMRVGGRRTLIVPAHLAYGSRGAPPKGNGGGVGIPPYATLVFRLELLNAQ